MSSQIVKFANKTLNVNRLMEELRPIGVSNASFVGFEPDADKRLQVPKAERAVYASRREGGITTTLEADPGELHFDVDADPGAALDRVLADHDSTVLTARQLEADQRLADLADLRIVLDTGRNLSPADIKMMLRAFLARP